MNYTEFVNAVKEKLTQELNGGVRVNVYTTKKNNATERTGLILETPGVNISPTIYLEEFFELYEKGKQMDWIIEDLVELYEEIRQEKSWDYERMLSFDASLCISGETLCATGLPSKQSKPVCPVI